MFQVVLRIPPWSENGLPLYGYGLMLFLAFMACNWLSVRLARREGISPEAVQDLILYLFLGGLLGSRIVYLIQYDRFDFLFHSSLTFGERLQDLGAFLFYRFIAIWDGGLVFYGGLLGGTVAFVLAQRTLLRKHQVPTLRLAEVIGPCVALGLCLGRIGCLLNGCCYGGVACPHCPAVYFPMAGQPRGDLVRQGLQTTAGFTLADIAENDHTVGFVEPGSAAAAAGLQTADVIVEADGHPVTEARELSHYFYPGWPRGKNDLTLTVERGKEVITIGPFTPRSIGLHPTQIYESISALLLMVVLLTYRPFQRHSGEGFALFLILYPIHRFLNEMLRIDNEPIAFGLTLSQNVSVFLLVLGLIFMAWLRRLPPDVQLAN